MYNLRTKCKNRKENQIMQKKIKPIDKEAHPSPSVISIKRRTKTVIKTQMYFACFTISG